MTTATTVVDEFRAQFDASAAAHVELHVARWVNTLGSLRRTMPRPHWEEFCREVVRRSELLALLHKDPFTGHAFRRPRGYPGDADLIDYIYKHPSRFPALLAADSLGQSIYAYTGDSSACRSVRQRREMLAAEIDRTAAARDRARVLSFACGHLREGLLSNALAQGQLGGLWAVDQDLDSLAEVERTFSGFPVQTVQGTVLQLIRRQLELPEAFDFVYTAGLFDYLADKASVRVTDRLLDRVAPGGKLWVVNFLPDIPDVGYMEACMDWWLIYRDETAMSKILDGISPEKVASSRLFREPEGNLCFLEIVRR